MKTSLTTLIFISFFVLICSCDSGTNRNEAVLKDQSLPDPRQITNEALEKATDRKIIRQGELTFETRDLKKTASLILQVTKELDGYISEDNIYSDNERITHRYTIKVPSENFDLLLNRISEFAEKVDSRFITAEDVTEEYIDVESRIKTKKELENKYRELLGRAKTVEEILSIEKEMGTLRTEIESIEGRLKYLNDRVNFSSLKVDFYQHKNAPFNFSSRFGQAIVTGWNFLLEFIIGLVHLWTFILIIGAGIILGSYFRKKRKKKIE